MSEQAEKSDVNVLSDVDMSGTRLRRVRLRGARFRMVDLSGTVMRDISLEGASIDGGQIAGLRINGVEVAPLVEAELRRREPVRNLLEATDPTGLRAAWGALEGAWAEAQARVDSLPEAVVDESVEDEWSYAQTLRHLVFVTDAWLGPVLDADTPVQQSFHPWGLPFTELPEWVEGGAAALGIDEDATPAYVDVQTLRSERVARVRDFLAQVTSQTLQQQSVGPPWSGPVSVLRCLHVVFDEECEHLHFARRDLDAIEQRRQQAASS